MFESGFISTIQNFFAYFVSGGFWVFIRTAVIVVAAVLLAGPLAKKADHFVRQAFARRRADSGDTLQDKRVVTVGTLVGSIARYAVWGIAFAVCLSALGLGSAASSLVAAAGLSGGLVIGFGAQKLLQDFFAGFIYVTDHPFAVGDTVTIDGKTGVVESLKLRTTTLRSIGGERHIFPNGSIGTITNHSVNNSLAACDIYLPATRTLEELSPILLEAAVSATKDHPDVVEPPQVLGITAFTDRGMMCVRTICRAKPFTHWAIERAIRAAQLAAIVKAEIKPAD